MTFAWIALAVFTCRRREVEDSFDVDKGALLLVSVVCFKPP